VTTQLIEARYIVLVGQQEAPRVVLHAGDVELDHLHAHVAPTVDVIRIGAMPSGAHVDVWVDDEGLMRDSVKPNRRAPNGWVICGPFLVCSANAEGDSLGFSREDADTLAALIAERWPLLDPESEKPEPFMTMVTWEVSVLAFETTPALRGDSVPWLAGIPMTGAKRRGKTPSAPRTARVSNASG
jgi:hypothetical protein